MPKKTFMNLSQAKQKRIITAAINEFAERSFQDAKISNIIKNSQIPRGSFYQYFNDKKDIYLYIFSLMSEDKLKTIGGTLNNPENISFIELFKQLYKEGLEFASKNPLYMKIFQKLILSDSEIYDDLVGDGNKFIIKYYSDLIEKDKLAGKIRQDVDTLALADLVNEITNNITINASKQEFFNYDEMMGKVNAIITIISKGIQ